mmetsp:Transcript_473/g.1128  ORF Transcript_473/g.1128 Transcript_473/m.1128 type:complete len:86 (+) Transcript_473:18-275(+)
MAPISILLSLYISKQTSVEKNGRLARLKQRQQQCHGAALPFVFAGCACAGLVDSLSEFSSARHRRSYQSTRAVSAVAINICTPRV